MVFSKSPYDWNCVDVLGNDGIYRFGRVVDVADNEKGLIVDLCCADRRRETIPFSKVFHASYGREIGGFGAYFESFNPYYNDEIAATSKDGIIEIDGPGPEVEVLVREHLSGPWIWLPGKLYISLTEADININNLAQVEWYSSDGKTNTDIFPCTSVRRSQKEWIKRLTRKKAGKPQCVAKDDFVKHRLRLELATAFLVDSVSKKEFLRLLSEFVRSDDNGDKWPWTTDFNMHVIFVDVKDGHLHYMRPNPKCGTSQNRTCLSSDSECTSKPEVETKIIEAVDEVLRFAKRDAKEKARAMLIHTIRVLHPRTHCRKTAKIQTLPPELLGKILSYPDTITQTRLQLVCSVWMTILSENSKVNDTIWIAESPFWDRDAITPDYVVVSTIVKYLSPAIKRIVLTYGSPRWVEGAESPRWFDGQLLAAAGSMNYVFVTGIPVDLQELLLHRWKFTFQTGLHQGPQDDCEAHYEAPDELASEGYDPYTLPHFFVQCSDLDEKYLHCKELGLVNCLVTLFHSTLDEEHVLGKTDQCKVEIVINVVRGRIDLAAGNFECALWELLEASLPAADNRQKKMVTQWIKWLTNNQDSERRKALLQMTLKILCEVQTKDPRKTLQYRGKMWCQDGLTGIKLNKLSRITMHFLIKLAGQFPEGDDVEAPTDHDE
ncbi:uncharacterized protein LOC129596793 [Paramacrobiotus metropolitanus]|uniref:uncharacterized protein LOC129596793 n=1 Tax=Paramacrobiotus metropolitanus TaxID=2943436 RepID=UPI002445B23E|nr:uncharacterized protein LOC129596793 [Paramacrobiotus metropolitanus]XP_055350133.1 uncharacterized protein LOC129596793 [Paramacrobiotus metropolitanus]XP_055350134.1 uncharacterized protein LOC129596793 [Paramacrobiotus metropolitanus]